MKKTAFKAASLVKSKTLVKKRMTVSEAHDIMNAAYPDVCNKLIGYLICSGFSQHASEDAAHDAFVTLYDQMTNRMWDPSIKPDAFLFRVAIRKIVRATKREEREPSLVNQESKDGRSLSETLEDTSVRHPLDGLITKEDREILKAKVSKLRGKTRLVLQELLALKHATRSELKAAIRARLGDAYSPTTVKSALQYGKMLVECSKP